MKKMTNKHKKISPSISPIIISQGSTAQIHVEVCSNSSVIDYFTPAATPRECSSSKPATNKRFRKQGIMVTCVICKQDGDPKSTVKYVCVSFLYQSGCIICWHVILMIYLSLSDVMSA